MTSPLGATDEETQVEKLKVNEYLTGKLPLKIKPTNKSTGGLYIAPNKEMTDINFIIFKRANTDRKISTLIKIKKINKPRRRNMQDQKVDNKASE